MEEIELYKFIAIVFDATQYSTIPFKQFGIIKNIIEKKFPNISIDWYRYSYLFAINFYSYLFDENESNNAIICKNLKYLHNNMRYFLDCLDKNTINSIYKIISDYRYLLSNKF